jgi:hypothetical protein
MAAAAGADDASSALPLTPAATTAGSNRTNCRRDRDNSGCDVAEGERREVDEDGAKLASDDVALHTEYKKRGGLRCRRLALFKPRGTAENAAENATVPIGTSISTTTTAVTRIAEILALLAIAQKKRKRKKIFRI